MTQQSKNGITQKHGEGRRRNATRREILARATRTTYTKRWIGLHSIARVYWGCLDCVRRSPDKYVTQTVLRSRSPPLPSSPPLSYPAPLFPLPIPSLPHPSLPHPSLPSPLSSPSPLFPLPSLPPPLSPPSPPLPSHYSSAIVSGKHCCAFIRKLWINLTLRDFNTNNCIHRRCLETDSEKSLSDALNTHLEIIIRMKYVGLCLIMVATLYKWMSVCWVF